jgi:hypothetical protein
LRQVFIRTDMYVCRYVCTHAGSAGRINLFKIGRVFACVEAVRENFSSMARIRVAR